MLKPIYCEGSLNYKAFANIRLYLKEPTAPLVFRTWPELEEQITEVNGFHPVDAYNSFELDSMARGEIGRVMGFHIVVNYRNLPVYNARGQILSSVHLGTRKFLVASNADSPALVAKPRRVAV